LERRWRRWREAQVLEEVRRRLAAPQVYSGTVAELKDEIDAELTRVTLLLTAIPGVALLVAAIGVANLMTANVTARAKQLAILRAVGATRGLVLRMVVGEALVLGLLGSALGLALGLHLAANITELVDRMWGFRVALRLPWGYVIATILLTVGLCIVAGALPARHASRTDIVDALHVP
jgi:putative ABC transport system permease protein